MTMVLRTISSLVSKGLIDPTVGHKAVFLEEWMLKPLWAQLSLGVQNPSYLLPGITGKFLIPEEHTICTQFILDMETTLFLQASCLDLPGYEYQLYIERRTNG